MRKNKTVPNKEVDMTSIADVSVCIQTSSESVPSTPSWFGEVALIIPYLRKQGVLSAINSQVRLARRCGHYEVIDFLAVLFGYAISGERTLEEFYERLLPLEQPFMALFDRQRLPSRSALSRFLASLTWAATEALRTLFLADLLARPLDKERHTGQLVDRAGNEHVVFDIDGTRQAARQRALPKAEALPPAQRRLNQVCAPGYTGRKRGEVVRTRTVVSQAHSYHWLGSFGNSGNGLYREELRRALTAIRDESSGTPSFPFVCPAAMGWAVWDGGSHHGSGRFPLRDARQRLHRLGSTRDPEPFASPYRRAVQSLGKRPGATDLRLPRCRCGAR